MNRTSGGSGDRRIDRDLLSSLVSWSTLSAVLLSALALGANRPVSWTLLSLVVFSCFALQLIIDMRRPIGREARLLLPIGVLYLGVLVWGLVQVALPVQGSLSHPVWNMVPGELGRISADPGSGAHYVMRLATYGMVFWIALRASQSAHRAGRFLAAIAIFASLLSAFGLYSWASGFNIILLSEAGPLSASFVNRNNYATYAVFGLLANLGVYLHLSRGSEIAGGSRELRDYLEGFFAGSWIFAVGILLNASGLILSQSRAGAVAGALGLASFFAVSRRSHSASGRLTTLSLVVIVGFVLVVLSSGVFSRLLTTTNEDARFTFYPLIVDGIVDRPWLGHGVGAFQDTFRQYVPVELAFAEIDLGHSSYLENAYELGVPAAGVLMLCLAAIGAVLLRGALVRKRDRRIPAVALGCVVAAAFHAALDFSLQMPATAALFAFILGMGWAQAFPRSRMRSPRHEQKAQPSA